MNWEYSVELCETLYFAIKGETYSVDHKMRYSPALATALKPVYIQNRICKVLRSQTPQCGTPNWHMLMRITAILKRHVVRIVVYSIFIQLLTRRTDKQKVSH